MMAEQRIGRAVHPAQRRAPAPVHADGSLRFDEPARRRAGPAAQQQPAESASPPPPAGPPQSAEEAELRFWRRYGPRTLALLLGGEVIDPPDTIEGWYDLAVRTRDALEDPAGYAPAVLRRVAQALEQTKEKA